MKEITSEVGKKVLRDYQDNFMPRKEINLRLTFEEIKELLQDKELMQSVQGIAWHLKFYVKQLLLLSFEIIKNDSSIAEVRKVAMMEELEELVLFDSFNVARAFVALLHLRYFIESIRTFKLYDIFNGHSHYDDYCAQIAYEEFNKRGGKD